ncbi:SDR family oxidoreductase [Amycolatopsis benzoatilytica]|uniref:SDR family oxidoreductase n=1 Tax=Amycolatopsis benzoatilytica TaxID=346045 RepID=UPI0003657F87|nr:SDR family oxidoreductase [Amycolatopsis benzoatilytica]
MTDLPLALVTGASRGIGAAIAHQLSPTHRLLLGGRDADALAKVAAELPGAEPWLVDLTDAASLESAASQIDELDVLVHSAGTAQLGTVAEAPSSAWRTNLEVNVIAVAELTRLLLPALRSARGHVVVINSGGGYRARAGWGPYAASKFAARAFADSLREEEPDLRVTSIFPGRTDTDMQRAVREHEGGTYDAAAYLRPDSVATAVVTAVTATPEAHFTEIQVRPR